MPFGQGYWQAGALRAGILRVGILTAGLCVLGCHGNKEMPPSLLHVDETMRPAAKADNAAAVIAALCTRQSFATARLGLIAGETGLREDVFELRDPVSYQAVPYRLGATLRLEEMLRRGAEASGRPDPQAACMRQFADHLKALTDPLVETARDEKKIDISAFREAQREAQQERETETLDTDR